VANPAKAGLYQLSYPGIFFNLFPSFPRRRESKGFKMLLDPRFHGDDKLYIQRDFFNSLLLLDNPFQVVNPAEAGLYQLSYPGIFLHLVVLKIPFRWLIPPRRDSTS
jgi:hypothetical protein